MPIKSDVSIGLRGGARTVVLLTVPLLVIALWLQQQWGGVLVTEAVDDLSELLFAALATGCALSAARRSQGRQRDSWLALAVGTAGWTVGEAIWSYYELSGVKQTPFPSLADAGFLLFPLGGGAALMLFPTRHPAHSRARLILDGVMVAGSLFTVSWVTALGSVYRAGADNTFAFAISLAYPVSDLITVSMTVIIIARAELAHRASLSLLGAGIALVGVADSGFVYLAANGTYYSSMIDLGWTAGFAVLGLAALCSTPAETAATAVSVPPTRTWIWLPYLPVLLAGVVGARHLFPSVGSGPVPAVALILVATLLARQLLVLAENRRLLLAVTAQAFRDPLTGLANRALFMDRLTHALERHRRQLSPVALLMLDLDHFKQINDTYGHAAGDQLLVRVAERLTGALRVADTIARLGGDEFAVLVEDDALTAQLLAERIAEAFAGPFVLDGRAHMICPSIGVAAVPVDGSDMSPDELLKNADQAMYARKRAGSGPRTAHRSRVSERHARPGEVVRDGAEWRARTAPTG